MSTKAEVLKLLEENKGQYFSGEEIAKVCNVSRNAIWKAIKKLQSEGYKIDAISNKGYSLSLESDILSVEGIQKYLKDDSLDIHVETCVTSTNTLTVQQAIAGQKEGYILISGMQTQGKGRTGHSFYSPERTGLYMSILLRPPYSPMEATNITSMAGVAACEAMESFGLEPKIKWINDIFLNGKKVVGILSEASISMENLLMDYVVLGIGFNVYAPENGFPQDIKDIAGCLFTERINDGKNKLAAAFIQSFMKYYRNWNKEDYYQSYKDHNFILNKEVQITTPNGLKTVFAKDIDKNFELIVEDNGQEKVLSSGEVHIKLY